MKTYITRSVSWLVRQAASCIDSAPVLHNVVVEGELSNFHAHPSGHWYFTLKDDHARIDCTMWSSDNRQVSFSPKNGDLIRVFGGCTVYPVQGKLQFTVRRMIPAGLGDLKAQFDALYKKLLEEGLFDPAHKKLIPAYPMTIALVTGKETHARADVRNTLARRWPIAEIIEFNALVQGENAPADLIRQLKKADGSGADVILLCRGGGSMEDLWCFNDEQLVRVIYEINTPLITGIGHEPDWTMADYAADLRAPTPTGAAEQASPDIRQVQRKLGELRAYMETCMRKRISEERQALDRITAKPWYSDPMSLVRSRQMEADLLGERFFRHLHTSSMKTRGILQEKKLQLEKNAGRAFLQEHSRLNQLEEALTRNARYCIENKRNDLQKAAGLLDAYSPLKVLGRGYSVIAKDSHVINDARMLEEGDRITIRFFRGSAEASVIHKENGGES